MSWYYSKNGTQLGPVPEEELLAKSKSGEVLPSDLIWKEGMGDWKPLGQVPEFAGIPSSAVSVPPAVPTAGSGNVPIPQPTPYSGSPQPAIPNYLWQSIVVTLFCCMPCGVVGIVFASKVDGLQARGDIAGATAASQSAKTWTMVGGGLGLCVVGFYIVMVIIAAANGGLN